MHDKTNMENSRKNGNIMTCEEILHTFQTDMEDALILYTYYAAVNVDASYKFGLFG